MISESLPEVQKIQIVSKNLAEKSTPHQHIKEEPKIKPLVSGGDIDEIRSRLPFINPNRGDYYLNRTQSTEGVASKISLELKKKYLLGGDNGSNVVKKSGSASVLDTKFKSFVDQISEHQKLLNPAPEPSVSMQMFLEGASKLRRSPTLSPTASVNVRKSKELTGMENFQHICSQQQQQPPALPQSASSSYESSCSKDSQSVTESTTVIEKASSPVFETSIVVPELPKKTEPKKEVSSSNESSADDYEDEENSYHNVNNDSNCNGKVVASAAAAAAAVGVASTQISLPKVEIHNSQGELLPNEEGSAANCSNDNFKLVSDTRTGIPGGADEASAPSKIMAMPLDSKEKEAQILKHVSTPAELFISTDAKKSSAAEKGSGSGGAFSDKSSPSTPTSIPGDDNTLAVFTETELSDWARDEDCAVSENFDDLILGTHQNITYRRHQKPKKRANRDARNAKSSKSTVELGEDFVHVCGKAEPKSPSFMLANIDDMDIEFMDTGGDEEDEDAENGNAQTVNPLYLKNSGYIEYVTSEDEAKTPLAEAVNSNYAASFAEFDKSLSATAAAAAAAAAPAIRSSDLDENSNANHAEKTIRADEFDNFIHSFQDRISPFGYVKDSIDIRKQKKSAAKSPPPPLAVESSPVKEAAKEPPSPPSTPNVFGPTQKLEQLSRERSKQKNLIHEMVMSKLQSEGKSLQDRKSKRNSRTSLSPYNSSSQNSLQGGGKTGQDEKKEDCAAAKPILGRVAKEYKENIPYSSLDLGSATATSTRKEKSAMTDSCTTPTGGPSSVDGKCAESFSLPDIRKALSDTGDKLLTPVLSSATRMQILQSTESIRQQARTRARLMSDSELGLSPEDKLKLLKQKIAARKAVQSAFMDYPRSAEYLDEKECTSSSSKALHELHNAIADADYRNNNVSRMECAVCVCVKGASGGVIGCFAGSSGRN